MTPKEYVESGKHLPPFLKDFHDQKDFFKMVHSLYDHGDQCQPDWVKAHIYTIDWFLWYLGQRGWILQRSRAKVDFVPMEVDMQHYKKAVAETFDSMMADWRAERSNGSSTADSITNIE